MPGARVSVALRSQAPHALRLTRAHRNTHGTNLRLCLQRDPNDVVCAGPHASRRHQHIALRGERLKLCGERGRIVGAAVHMHGIDPDLSEQPGDQK